MKSNVSIQLTPSLCFLSHNQREDIHFGALELLENTGVQILHSEAISILREAGAIIDEKLVRIPEALLKRALSTTPSRVVMANRHGERKMFLEGKRSYFGTGSCCPYTIDPFSGQRRLAEKTDVANMAKLCDYLHNIDFVMSMNLVRHPSPEMGYIHEFDTMLRNTTKPIIVSAQNGDNVYNIIKMAQVTMGGSEDLRKKPMLAVYSESTSPLRHAEDAVSKLLICAEHRIPLIHTVGIMAGATAPITLAGAIVQANAELLSGLVIHQLKQPGAPFIYGGTITAIDMKTMAHPYGAPEFHVASAALTEMGEYYSLPVFSTGGCSDAKSFDEQAAAEAAYSLLLASLSGGNLIHDIGYIDSGLTSSLSQIVFSDEMIELIKHVTSGISFKEDDLALNIIHDVGPGGHFLAEKHTLDHFRKIYSPKLFTRHSYANWETSGKKSLSNIVNDEVVRILDNHIPDPIDKEIIAELDKLIVSFDSN